MTKAQRTPIPKSEDDFVEAFCKNGSPADRSATRRLIRSIKLSSALKNTRKSDEEWVVATADGRTLCQLEDKTFGLDVGDSPRHWADERAQQLAERWNRTAFEKDQVRCIYWRDHYESQIERLKTGRP